MGFRKYNRAMIKVFNQDHVEEAVAAMFNAQYEMHKYNNVYVAYGNGNALVTDTNIAVASFITAYSRIRYHQLVVALMSRGANVYYGDTDSIATDYHIENDVTLCEEFMGPGQGVHMGELKREYVDYDIIEGVFVGLKLYGLHMMHKVTGAHIYTNKIKGVNTRSSLAINDLDITDHAHKGELVYDSLMYLCTTGNAMRYRFNIMQMSRVSMVQGKLGIVDRDITRTITGKYTKGTVDPKTGVVVPLYIPSNMYNT
jgi:hypothetical protein